MPSFYETDIAPHASRFFSQVSADSRLSDAQRTRIQGTLLTGMEDITATRMKMQAERDEGVKRRLDREKDIFALEDARQARARIQQHEQKLGGIKEQAFGVLTADVDPETKRQQLAAVALENMDVLNANPGARAILGYATESLPKPEESKFTATRMLDLLQKGVPEEVLRSGNYRAIAAHAEAYEKEQAAVEEAKKMSAQQKAELAKMPLKYAKWTNPQTQMEEEDRWLEPESTQRAKAIVAALGTPEELKRFDALKDDDSDRKRKELVTDIQLRALSGGEKKSSGYGARIWGR